MQREHAVRSRVTTWMEDSNAPYLNCGVEAPRWRAEIARCSVKAVVKAFNDVA